MSTLYLEDGIIGRSQVWDEANTSSLGAVDGNVADHPLADKVCLEVQFYYSAACNKAMASTGVKIQVSKDGGSFEDLSASEVDAYNCSGLSDEGASDDKCGDPAATECASGFAAGKECVDGETSLTVAIETYSNVQFGLDFSNGTGGATYTFQAYDTTNSSIIDVGQVLASVTLALAATPYTQTTDIDALLVILGSVTANIDTILKAVGQPEIINLDALLKASSVETTNLDALLTILGSVTANIDTILKAVGQTGIINLDSILKAVGQTGIINLDALLQLTGTKTTNLDALLAILGSVTANIDALLKAIGKTETVNLDALLAILGSVTANIDALLKAIGKTETVSLDALLQLTGLPQGDWCWGHVTGVAEDNVGVLSSGTGTGRVGGSGDAENVCLESGETWISPAVDTGEIILEITYDQYNTGSGSGTIRYRTGENKSTCEAAGWTAYTGPFESLGWAQIEFTG